MFEWRPCRIEELEPVASSLPVVTAEMGDTWIWGCPSDPRKVAEFRMISRLRAACFANSACSFDDARVRRMSWWLLKITEHTWGQNGTHDYVNWSNAQFHELRLHPSSYTGDNVTENEASWKEQRLFGDLAVAALEGHPLASAIRAALVAMRPPATPPSRGAAMVPVESPTAPLRCDDVGATVTFDGSGAIVRLAAGARSFSSPGFGRFNYATHDEADFDGFVRFYREAYYRPPCTNTSSCNHGTAWYKPNISAAGAESTFGPGKVRFLGLDVKDARCAPQTMCQGAAFFLMRLYRALKGCSCGSRGFLEDRMMDIITGRAPPPARAGSSCHPSCHIACSAVSWRNFPLFLNNNNRSGGPGATRRGARSFLSFR